MIESIGGLDMHNSFLFLAAAALVFTGWMARWRGCTCKQCTFHVNENRMDAEKRRAQRHRASHNHWRIPWGDEKCGSCKAGNDHDRIDT